MLLVVLGHVRTIQIQVLDKRARYRCVWTMHLCGLRSLCCFLWPKQCRLYAALWLFLWPGLPWPGMWCFYGLTMRLSMLAFMIQLWATTVVLQVYS
jgi:hypothetical protein